MIYELTIKQKVLKLVIYVTYNYNKTSNQKIFYTHTKKQLNIALTLFVINRMLILWCLNVYVYDDMLNFYEKVLTS